MKRQLHRIILYGLAFSLSVVAAGAASSQHSGEILGTHPGERTLTLRIIGPDGKEVLVFHVPEETVIRDHGSKKEIRFEELKAGMRATVTSRREEGERRATEISVRRSP